MVEIIQLPFFTGIYRARVDSKGRFLFPSGLYNLMSERNRTQFIYSPLIEENRGNICISGINTHYLFGENIVIDRQKISASDSFKKEIDGRIFVGEEDQGIVFYSTIDGFLNNALSNGFSQIKMDSNRRINIKEFLKENYGISIGNEIYLQGQIDHISLRYLTKIE